jgi:hypothetical protein
MCAGQVVPDRPPRRPPDDRAFGAAAADLRDLLIFGVVIGGQGGLVAGELDHHMPVAGLALLDLGTAAPE